MSTMDSPPAEPENNNSPTSKRVKGGSPGQPNGIRSPSMLPAVASPPPSKSLPEFLDPPLPDVSEKSPTRRKSGAGGSNGPSLPTLTKRSVTLQMLLAAGILKPGESNMSLEYHGQKFMGDLMPNGQITSQETSQVFSSPSAWAIACKQIINPDKVLRKSGCGWAAIKYRGLKLDYYKTVWFKRLREGSIDIRNISNGASSSDSEEEEYSAHTVLSFGEHYDHSSAFRTASSIGTKVLIECSEFKEVDRLQPFHVKVSSDALALADLHCNLSNTEATGYLSGSWNGDANTVRIESVHPVRILTPLSTEREVELERNRVAEEVSEKGHSILGWYHSHPHAPPQPSKDDVVRQLDFQVSMKGSNEATYIPCLGLIISPLCYSAKMDGKSSAMEIYWVLPPPENRPSELGRPMRMHYDKFSASNFDTQKLITELGLLLDFYKRNKEVIDINDLSGDRLAKIKETASHWVTGLETNDEFWSDLKEVFQRAPPPPSPSPPTSPEVEDEVPPDEKPESPVAGTSASSQPPPPDPPVVEPEEVEMDASA